MAGETGCAGDAEAVADLRFGTARLDIVPFTPELMCMALNDRGALAARLGVRIPDAWPNAAFAEVLPMLVAATRDDPTIGGRGWTGLMLHRAEGVLVGELGSLGGPDADGVVEIGYGVVPDYRGRGLATEAVAGIVAWLAAQTGVRGVVATCEPDNAPSIRVLEKVGGWPRTGGTLLEWTLWTAAPPIGRPPISGADQRPLVGRR